MSALLTSLCAPPVLAVPASWSPPLGNAPLGSRVHSSRSGSLRASSDFSVLTERASSAFFAALAGVVEVFLVDEVFVVVVWDLGEVDEGVDVGFVEAAVEDFAEEAGGVFFSVELEDSFVDLDLSDPSLFTGPSLFSESSLFNDPSLFAGPSLFSESSLFNDPSLFNGPSAFSDPSFFNDPSLFSDPDLLTVAAADLVLGGDGVLVFFCATCETRPPGFLTSEWEGGVAAGNLFSVTFALLWAPPVPPVSPAVKP